MIVVMQKGATQEQVDHMVERVEALGLKSHVIVGTERTVIAAIGEKREQMKESLESGAGVANHAAGSRKKARKIEMLSFNFRSGGAVRVGLRFGSR